MSRLFWMAVGATAGVAVTRKVSRTVDRFAPDGVAGGLAGLGATVRDFADEVLASMAEREWELRESMEARDSRVTGLSRDRRRAATPQDVRTALPRSAAGS